MKYLCYRDVFCKRKNIMWFFFCFKKSKDRCYTNMFVYDYDMNVENVIFSARYATLKECV